jgi:diadenosine tetraphosphate (Ap4A) HIT family hydrolase
MAACFNCEQDASLADLPVRDRVYVSPHWRIVHAWSALPGWLVLIARRHLLTLGELSGPEAIELGRLLSATSAALCAVTGCPKTYVVMFAEQPGFEHIHFHLVPRMADFDQAHRGSGVFEFLKRPESEWVSAQERDRLAMAIAEAMEPSLR